MEHHPLTESSGRLRPGRCGRCQLRALGGTVALALCLLAGCGIRQAVYVPQGFQELAADGSYVQDYAGVIVHLPLLVVNKSDVTLHPSITVDPRGHDVRVASAFWHVSGTDRPPLTPPNPGISVTSRTLLDLHWNIASLGPAVSLLGASSWIDLELMIDGVPHEVRIEFDRSDRF